MINSFEEKFLKVWTDGACSGNPGNGGAAALILSSNGEVKPIALSAKNTTNQRMEISAVILAINTILNHHYEENCIQFYTDSAYVCNCINQKWYENWFKNGWLNSKKEPVKNKDLWESLLNKIIELKNYIP